MNSDSSPPQKSDSEPKVDPWTDSQPEAVTFEAIPAPAETLISQVNTPVILNNSPEDNEVTTWEQRVADLQQQERILKQQIASLQGDYTQQIA
ncbi:MAG: hypothetical protein WBV73_15740, partial [Phormidium sp.]